MPKSCSLKSYSHRRKLCARLKTGNRKPWGIACTRACIVFTMFSILLSLCGSVGADSFPPSPARHIIVEETCISVSLTTPARTVFINVTEYYSKQIYTRQIVKNVTIEFFEPVTYVSFKLQVLSKRPSYVGALDNSTVLQYYAITFLTGAIKNVEMDFAIEKDDEQKSDVNGETLVLYQYNGEKMEECPTEKIEEDDASLYFKTNTEGTSYVAVTGGVASSPSWLTVIIIAAVALIIVIGIYGYKKPKLTNLRKMLRTGYGK